MSEHLYGIHDFDPTWAAWVRDAGVSAWCVTTHEYGDLHELSHMAAYNVTPIARLNWSHHGQGTIPPSAVDDGDFAAWCGKFADVSPGCKHFIVANEPNWSVEWGGGSPITPGRYAACYLRAHDAIKAMRPDAIVMPAAIAPWNVESGMGWVEYFAEMLTALHSNYDAINLHTYSRGYMPAAVASEDRMDAPWNRYRNGFRTYRDFLDAVPAGRRHLPVHITETNGNGVWPSDRSGWVQAAYAEIDAWNHTDGTQKIAALTLFRWPRFDQRWQFETKGGVHADFRDALHRGYRAPAPTAPASSTLHLPALAGGGPASPPSPQRDWDERLTARGVRIETPPLSPGQRYLRVVRGRWLDVAESGGRHHILADVLDDQGDRMVGVPLRVTWPGGEATIVTEAKPGEPWSANFPMSSSRNEFSIGPMGGGGERVTGIGMGADLGGGFNAGEHTSTALVWQLAVHGETQPAPEPTPVRVSVPPLMHPLWPGAPVTQPFGVNPERYARFNLDGHNGLDFGVPVGTPVKAVDDGRVAEAHDDPAGYGKYVKLLHTWGESLLAHLSAARVAVGATVAAGQVIGLSGNSGYSTGPHLHLGVRVNPYTRGRPFDGYRDPAPLLVGAANPEPPTTPATAVPRLILEAAREFGVDENLLLSLIWRESSFNPNAVNQSSGAKGLGQFMDQTWRDEAPKVGAINVFDARDNARTTASYLSWLIRTTGSERRGLWSYVWGVGRVMNLGKPGYPAQPPAEVMGYANTIIFGRDLLKAVGV